MANKKLIRFDWAMKKILRHKSNFDILEGFLSELLGEDVKIKQILESEGNKETADDKYNRVDIIVENEKNELVLIEIQNSQEHDYFQRMLYGVSKAITEHLSEGAKYAQVKKVIAVTIAYFDLGQGKDYVYHGKTTFKGIHKGDLLGLSKTQIALFNKTSVHQIYPEYWVIKTEKFDDNIKDTLDEWVYFFKNGEIKDNFSAKGIKAAGNRLDKMKMNEQEQKEYNWYLKHLHDVASNNFNREVDIKEKIDKAVAEEKEKTKAAVTAAVEQKEKEAILNFYEMGVSEEKIAQALNLSIEKVQQIIKEHHKD